MTAANYYIALRILLILIVKNKSESSSNRCIVQKKPLFEQETIDEDTRYNYNEDL
jgi:hypothetical protein